MGVFRDERGELVQHHHGGNPETMAENRNTIGISGEDHHGLAFTEPKINPTYPCSRNAEGMPMTVTIQPTLSSMRRAPPLIFYDPA